MSLATRCTSCGTVFRVVQDQLKVSEGWVRCGRCSEVFSALEGLFDLDREAPSLNLAPPPVGPVAVLTEAARPAAPAPVAAEVVAVVPVDAHRSDPDPEPTLDEPFDEPLDEPTETQPPRLRRSDTARKPTAAKVGARDRLEFSDARFDSDLFIESTEDDVDHEAADSMSTSTADLPLEHPNPPEFLRRADRTARWRSQPARIGLGLLSLLAVLLLAAQATHHFRDVVAARWPASRPALLAWCAVANCRIEAPRSIDDVSVESTALTKDTGVDSFRLAVTLRSHSTLALTTPSVNLNLTDAGGRVVARRVLSPQDFHVASVLAPGAETTLQMLLAARNARVSAYTVEIFYP